MIKLKKYFLLGTSLLLTTFAFCQVKLPKLISDGMVLQRDVKVKIWGWSAPNENISLDFVNKKYKIKANNKGEWELLLPVQKAGGPYVMKITASNIIEINDILIGDVWLCSGQSNMALTVSEVRNLYENEITNSENKYIRTFEVPREYDFVNARTDLSGGSWKEANPKNVLKFSATAYFFAKKLYAALKIPIGLVNASQGSSFAECWMSEETLKSFPESYNEIQLLKKLNYVNNLENKEKELEKIWNATLMKNDEGGISKNNWIPNSTNSNDWSETKIPGFWNTTSLGKINGVVWYKKEIEVSKNMASNESILELGTITGIDSTYINGKLVGNEKNLWISRKYIIPANTFIEGKNSITIRIIANRGNGGFTPGTTYAITSKNETINLAGIWKYKLGAKLDPLPQPVNIKLKPTGLYNAMIEPLKNYDFKGVIWYQGEANTKKPKEYAQILPALINNWRTLFKAPLLPFLYVQLPNFMAVKDVPSESNWALLRESQLKALSVPNTGMATTIDLGEWNNIHPHKKKEVGSRLALVAQKVVYDNSKVICSGPKFKSVLIEKDKVILSFSTFGSTMQFIGEGAHTNFAIAGKDKKFVWAEVKIENGKITVWSKEVPNPVAVRYAWADNPDGKKIFNTEGLPASPFRTDSW